MQHNLTSTAVALISFQWLLNKNPLTFSTVIPCFPTIARSLRVSLPDSYVMISEEIRKKKMYIYQTVTSQPRQPGHFMDNSHKTDSEYLRMERVI